MQIMEIINIPMGYVIRFLNNLVGGEYIIALLLFAIFIEILLLPFGIKQQKNSIKQAKLRPKEMAIRKKYAGRDDNVTKQKVTQEIQELYTKEGYSPFQGCLPLLIQLPIMFALYYIVLNPLRYICQLSETAIDGIISVVKSFDAYSAVEFATDRTIDLMDAVKNIISEHGIDVFSGIEGFSERIMDISDLPNTMFFGVNLAGTPDIKVFNWLLLVPVLTFLSYFFSMKMNRKLMYQPTMAADDKATGCSNQMMDWTMPLMSVWICFMVPAAIGVYWIFKSLLGVLKQWILKKSMPIPVFTEEDYKAAEKEYGAKAEKPAKSNKGPKPGVRSLHHIDDEDFPDTAPAALERKKALEALEAEKKANEPKVDTPIAKAPLKEDDRHKKAEEEKNTEANDSEKN